MQAQICANEKADLEEKNAALQTVKAQNQHLMDENTKLKTTIASNVEEMNTLKLRLDEIRAMVNMKVTPGDQSSEAKTEGSQ